jgi:hypothetical protein
MADSSKLPRFDPKGETQSVSQRWKRWKRALELFLVSKGIENDNRKKATLLHYAGFDTQDVYYSLVDVDNDDKNFTEALQILDDHFLPQCNVPFERHQFRQINQDKGESIDAFVCRLRQSAKNCDFGENSEDQIRDQLIDKCGSNRLRRKLLEAENLTLDAALKIAHTYEAVERQSKVMASDKVIDDSEKDCDINALGGQGRYSKSKRNGKP